MALRDLLADLKHITDDHRRHVLETLRITQEEGARASMEYLAEPRNSLVIRMRPEALAAIRRTIPVDRFGSADDIARAVLFFVRDAPYVTGQDLAVCGGRSVAGAMLAG